MLHVLTVHWLDDTWIPIQAQYLKKYAGMPYRVYSYLNGIEGDFDEFFHYVSRDEITSHPVKLNLLAEEALRQSKSDDDLLLFLDGDAFPIANLAEYLRPHLEKVPLVAIQRLENMGDAQPHPCFCVTTVGFWKEIKGDWMPGYTWRNTYGAETTDVGGNLLGLLETRKQVWHPMLRCNNLDLHSLWFGVYDHVAYHHGAGFRPSVSRKELWEKHPILWNLHSQLEKLPKNRITKSLRRRLNPDRIGAEKIAKSNRAMSDHILERIRVDDHFYEQFIS
jgi:hypothetical protein